MRMRLSSLGLTFLLYLFAIADAAAYSFPTLSDAPGARAVGLGEAFGAVNNDVSAFHYNPSSLSSLKQPQASIFYEKGAVDDSYGQLMAGLHNGKFGVGAFVSYYDEGTLEFYDDNSIKTIAGRKELSYGFTVSQTFNGFRLGLSGKNISSQLIEGVESSAWAADLGAQIDLKNHSTMGLSVRNLGPSLHFSGEEVSLPREARLSFGTPLNIVNTTVLFVADGSYALDEKDLSPRIGTELPVGPLALRIGLQRDHGETEYSLGTGFTIRSFSLDYALLVAPLIDAQHKFSLNVKFGNSNADSFSNKGEDISHVKK